MTVRLLQGRTNLSGKRRMTRAGKPKRESQSFQASIYPVEPRRCQKTLNGEANVTHSLNQRKERHTRRGRRVKTVIALRQPGNFECPIQVLSWLHA